jgi:uncharacterized delta-60 repeat protein
MLLMFGAAPATTLSSPALAAPGDLDSTFGQGGVVVLDAPPGLYAHFTDVDVGPDGSIAAAGSIERDGSVFGNAHDMLVAKLTPSGDPDPNFNGGQPLRLPWPGDRGSAARAVAFAPDGKIVVAGGSHEIAEETISQLAVARVNQDGTLDTTFGPGGVGAFDIDVPGTLETEAFDIAVYPDGRVVLAGRAEMVTAQKPVVVRLQSNGILDTGFDQDGIAVVPLGTPTQSGIVVTAAIGADGRITTAGSTRIGFDSAGIVVRHLPDGRLDPDFRASQAVEGFTTSGPPRSAFIAVGVLPDGRAMAAGFPGFVGAHAYAQRLLPSSARDRTYNASSSDPGEATMLASFNAGLRGAHVDDTGRVFFAAEGHYPTTLQYDFVLMVLEADGRPSTILGNGSGVRRYPIRNGALESPGAIDVGADGRIAMVGQMQDPVNTPSRPMVMRLEPVPPSPAGPPPPAASPSPSSAPAPTGGSIEAKAVGTTPRLIVAAGKKQDIDKLSISVEFNGSGTATATGTVSIPTSSRIYRFKRVTRSIASNRRVSIRLRLAKRPLRAAKRALRGKRKLVARIRVTIEPAAGDRIVRTQRIQLRP